VRRTFRRSHYRSIFYIFCHSGTIGTSVKYYYICKLEKSEIIYGS
jgi:hypothetical protein